MLQFLRRAAGVCGVPRSVYPDCRLPCVPDQIRSYAARRGTREKARKKKAAQKLQTVKKQIVPFKLQQASSKSLVVTAQRFITHDPGIAPIDDVYATRYFSPQLYAIQDAIRCHKQTHEPAMFGHPNAPLVLRLELDMSTEKKTKFMDNFTGIARLPHFYDDGKHRTVLAFCKKHEDQQAALEAGASVAGGQELIKQVLNSSIVVGDYRYVVATADIANDILQLRGIMKKRFPSLQRGTIGVNIVELVDKFIHSVEFTSEKDLTQHDFGWVHVPVGPISWPAEKLTENIDAVVKSVITQRNANLGPFITVSLLQCPPSSESLPVDISSHAPMAWLNFGKVEQAGADSDDEVEGEKTVSAET